MLGAKESRSLSNIYRNVTKLSTLDMVGRWWFFASLFNSEPKSVLYFIQGTICQIANLGLHVCQK